MIRFTSFLATLAALAAVLALPATSAAANVSCTQPAAAPPSDINTYLILAKNHFETKGGDAQHGFFTGGNVGVSNQGGTLQTSVNHQFKMSDDTALVGDISKIGPSVTKVWDVYSNTTDDSILNANVTKNSGPLCINAFPVVNNFPADPVFSPGVTTIDTSQDLDPGSYGEVDIRAGETLNLDTGTYNFKRFKLSEDGVVTTKDGTIINIAEDANGEGTWGTSDLTRWFVRGDGVDPNSNVLNFSVGESIVHGTFIVPNGEIALGHGTIFTGRVWGNSMHSDEDINFAFAAPESISGEKFEDTNGNGQHDQGEPALAGFKFYVDVNDNGQFDPNEPSADSDANGNWSIGPIYLTGNYPVREVGKTGYTCTFPAGNCSYSVDLGTAGVDHGGNDFGNKPTVPCVPTEGQDKNCQPVPVTPTPTPVTPQTVDSAKVSGVKSGCGTTSNVRVSGSNIAKVTYKIDGKTVKTVKKGPFRYKLKTKDYKVGAHKLKVTTTFKSGKTKTQTLTFQHCKKAQPHFTG